jgi:hypothetical protein
MPLCVGYGKYVVLCVVNDVNAVELVVVVDVPFTIPTPSHIDYHCFAKASWPWKEHLQ